MKFIDLRMKKKCSIFIYTILKSQHHISNENDDVYLPSDQDDIHVRIAHRATVWV